MTPPAFGCRRVVLEETTSTSDVARRLAAEEEAPEGTLVLARRQTAGRGRRGSSWFTGAAGGLAFSLVLRPPLSASRLSLLPLVLGLGAAESLQGHCGHPVQLKWPNDLLLADRKLGGILVETVRLPPRPVLAVAGVGINVAHRREDFPQELRDAAISLAAVSDPVPSPEQVLEWVLPGAEARYRQLCLGQVEPLVEAWNRHARERGHRVTVLQPDGELHGVIAGWDPDLGLKLQLPDGTSRRVPGERALSLVLSREPV